MSLFREQDLVLHSHIIILLLQLRAKGEQNFSVSKHFWIHLMQMLLHFRDAFFVTSECSKINHFYHLSIYPEGGDKDSFFSHLLHLIKACFV